MIFVIGLIAASCLVLFGLWRVYLVWRATLPPFPTRATSRKTVGTLHWLAKNPSGRLNRIDRFDYQAMYFQRLPRLGRELLTRFGWRPRIEIEPSTGRPSPDLVDAVDEVVRTMPTWLRNHSLRTYHLAHLHGTHLGYRFDDDVLYAAALLHDAGLLEPALLPPTPDRSGPATIDADCFTVRSAAVAGAVVAPLDGWGSDRIERLQEAITLHINPRVSKKMGVEAWLLHFAAGLDVAGIGFHQLYSAPMDAIYRQHRLKGQKQAVVGAWRAESADHKHCRAAALGQLKFSWWVNTSPIYDLYYDDTADPYSLSARPEDREVSR